MLPRNELVLRVVCVAAGAVLLYQAGHLLLHANPLAKVRIPELPTLTNTTDSGTAPTNAPPPGKSGTNLDIKTKAPSTNVAGTSSNRTPSVAAGSTNAPPAGATNLPSAETRPSTNETAAATNVRKPDVLVSNNPSTAVTGGGASTNPLGASAPVKSPILVAKAEKPVVGRTNESPSTNVLAGGTDRNPTNLAASGPASNRTVAVASARGLGMPPGGRPPGGMGGPGMQLAQLPKEIRAKLERIIDSEILAPVMRPMPTALLGIAGQDAFIRGPNGQTGLVREGGSLGSVKLLKIGTNRVLVEEEGETKELMIFNGMGGKSLMPAKTNSP